MLHGAKLKHLRQEKGWTQVDLGRVVGHGGAYIRKLETGRTLNPGCQTLALVGLGTWRIG